MTYNPASTMQTETTILIYSGGMDSTVLLYHLLEQNYSVRCLSVDYGQKHKKELNCAATICKNLNLEHKIIDLSSVAELLSSSSLINPDQTVPRGHYEASSMKATVVPNRNMLLLSLATAWAVDCKASTVSYAAHSGDHAIYPDCREVFAQGMDSVMQVCDWHSVRLNRPFVEMDKTAICKLGANLSVPFEQTWSCYLGTDLHCGCCGTCIERREAFHLASVADPTDYAPEAPTLEKMLETNWKLIEEN